MLRITANQDVPVLHGSSAALMPVVRHALAIDPGPVTIMIHGFKYQPGGDQNCPHHTIFSPRPNHDRPRVVSWPRHLGLRGQEGEGLGISFGWGARGSIWRAYDAAREAGEVLGRLLDQIHRIAPERPIHLIGHSLGARVALHAIKSASARTVRSAILLVGAEFSTTAHRCLRGSGTQVLNVTSRENDLFDFMMETLILAPKRGDRMLGHGVLDLPNVATLQLDDARTLKRLRDMGFPIAAPERRICHWSPYLRPGVFPLYRAFHRGDLPIGRLRAILPSRCEPRWSRLWPTRGFSGQFAID
ncbi:MAG: DUF726 domain-containing protein [Pelagimonas sp.]|jgi:pimeloyl-ACP methyl ester carboxylesterase|nr:DUF726 domain-containing protein [Pelagimonas sp.]